MDVEPRAGREPHPTEAPRDVRHAPRLEHVLAVRDRLRDLLAAQARPLVLVLRRREVPVVVVVALRLRLVVAAALGVLVVQRRATPRRRLLRRVLRRRARRGGDLRRPLDNREVPRVGLEDVRVHCAPGMLELAHL